MRPTRLADLALLLVVSTPVGMLLAQVWLTRTGAPADLPWAAPVTLALLAVALLLGAAVLRPRVRRVKDARPVDPLLVARAAVLALASSRAGAVVAGLYLGYGVLLLLDLANAYRRHLLLVAGLSFLAALAVVGAALVLERVCRVPPPTDDAASGTNHSRA